MSGNGLRFRNREDINDSHSKSWKASFDRYGMLGSYSPDEAYEVNYMFPARSKQANILFTKELQRRFDEEGIPIICTSLHPGTVNTGMSSSLRCCSGTHLWNRRGK